MTNKTPGGANQVLEPVDGAGPHYLHDYASAYREFRWEDIHQQFDWSKTGKVNMAHEAIDRHLTGGRRTKLALIYTDKEHTSRFTFEDLSYQSNRFANALRKLGVKKGDRVFVFMPRRPELYIAILGAIKIGAIPSPLFEAFMQEAVRDRMTNAEAVALVTMPSMLDRVSRWEIPSLKQIILVGAASTGLGDGQYSFEALMENAEEKTEIEWLTLEDPLIMHYTSGSTGKPKGVLHVQRAMMGHLMTGRWVLDLRDDDVYWCTADPGWVTGTSYGIFSPWLNGATNLIRGGRFSAADWYHTIERFRVNVWYSAPTAFRMLMAAGDEIVKQYDLSSLRHVLSVGEPLNPEVVWWGTKVYKRRIHDNWWMTETGHILLSNYPSMTIRPGSMGRPVPGVQAAIVDDAGQEVPDNTLGNLVVKPGWPGMMKTIWRQPERYETYFRIPGWYVSGDSAYRDPDGYFWFQGRVDDLIITAGENVGPFEVESCLVEHPAVAEAGVIGKPDVVRGQIIKAFVALREGYKPSDELKQEIQNHVKQKLAAHAAPREIEFRDKLPKTRSGKIMRRVLKAWELNLPTGDLSTLED
ncbi:MAG: acetate--CoA ligase [Acidobacteria bacterium]|nr:acetate--CoA ligase [Acidobacteriota bacterium]